MLEWLKTILGGAYTDDVDAKVSAEIGKNFVSKADFNQVNAAKKKAEDDVKERDRQLGELKNSSGDVDALKAQIGTLQKQNADAKRQYEADIARIRLDGAVDAALTAAGSRNNTATRALLADFLKDAKAEADGTVRGLSEKLAEMSKADATAFLFNTAGEGGQFRGMQPGSAGGKTPPPAGKKPKDMNYDELCAYLEANPGAKLE